MQWLALAAAIALLAVIRLVVLQRWRLYRLSHRRAALLYALVMPLVLVVASALSGLDSTEGWLLLLGVAVFMFLSTWAFAEWFLRAMGGEMDPPASRSYRKRP